MSVTRCALMVIGWTFGLMVLAGCPDTGTGDGDGNGNTAVNENTSPPNDNGEPGTNENDGGDANVNDNEAPNDNGSANDNDAGGNDNATGNDNDGGGTGNDNATGNDNDGGGTGNDNATANDNANDNDAGNDNENDNDNANDNANDNSGGNENDNDGGGGNGPPPDNTNDNSGGEGTVEVGCPGFDEVELSATPFAGVNPPDPLPDEPVTIQVGAQWGVVVTVGDLGNNVGPLFLLVTLDDNDINGDTGDLLVGQFVDEPQTLTVNPTPATEPGTFFVAATLKSAEASESGCDNVAQEYNVQVTVTFEDP